MASKKYCEYFDVNESYFPCIDESAINAGAPWETTYPQETFIDLLNSAEKMLGGTTNRSIWIHGAYGTGKSQCAYALKKILEVPNDELRAYWDRYEPLKKNKALLEKLIGHKEQGVLTAYRYASGSITSPQLLFLAVQESIRAALDAVPGSYKGENTLKESVIAWLTDSSHNAFVNSLLQKPEWVSEFSQSSADEIINAISALDFSQSLVPVSYIKTPFEAIQHVIPGVELTDSMGTTAQWEQFYQELLRCNGSLGKLFSRYDCADDFEEDIYEKCAGLEFKNWVFYISLKQNYDRIQNDYLAYVVANTDCYEDLRINLLTGIVHIPRSDGRFHNLYTERKKLVKGFPESEIAAFIRENQIDPMESIYRYTDNTKMEREAIISWVAQHGYIAEIEIIYPALAQYLGEYVFDCGGLSDELTKYFKQYRLMKVTNQITPEFLAQVEQNAQKLPYTHLETRDSAILRIPDKKDAFLYWIDALGVEYLSYIAILAKKKGLSIHVDIAYVELPTITSINKGFFEKWAGSKKEKEPRLDEIKHKEEGGYFYRPGQAPVHLASELEVIRKSIDRAATELAMHTCKTFVIASDHGASRLAVIHHQEEKYDTDTKGEHSGRCCKEFADADLPQAICENGYLVLADYGRFKNSRAANVEVHGGASLEEVIVPIITLSLKKQCDLIIELLNADEVYCDRRLGTTIQLYISDADNTQSISVVIDEKRYAAKGSDKTHYEVNLYDMRRAKKNVSAAIYDGDDLIGTVHFDIKGKMATVNNDFDDLF